MGRYWRTGLAFLIVVGLPLISYWYLKSGALKIHVKLPRYYPLEIDPATKDTIYHTIPDFKLLAQTGDTVTPATFKDKIVVADFFFTTCKGICLKMSSNLTQVQEAYKNKEEVNILSHSVNPTADSVPVLKNYADQYGAIAGKWYLVTGDKRAIYELARQGYKLPVAEGDGGPDDFIHSERLVLLDKERVIRGYYDGTDSAQVKNLIEDIRLLLREYNMKKQSKNK